MEYTEATHREFVNDFLGKFNTEYDLDVRDHHPHLVRMFNAIFDDLQATKTELDRVKAHLWELQREVDDIPKV